VSSIIILTSAGEGRGAGSGHACSAGDWFKAIGQFSVDTAIDERYSQ
jgi:hypothetical protein